MHAFELPAAPRRLNITHVVAVGVLVASLPAQWLVSRVVVGSIQVVPPMAGWQMAPVVVIVAVLIGLIAFDAFRPEPVSGLVRMVGVQALALAGALVVVMELVVSVLGIVWDTGSGTLRPGAGVWMVAVAGLLLVAVGDRDPLAHLIPGAGDSASTLLRLVIAGAWLLGLASTIWWTAWRNGPFAEIGPVSVVASTVPVVGSLSFLGVLACWVALALALVGRRGLAATMVVIGCLLLMGSVLASSLAVWAVELVPVDRLLASARSQAIEWTESAEILDAVPEDLAERLTPTVEGADVSVSVKPLQLWMALLITSTSLGAIAAMARRRGTGGGSIATVESIDLTGRPLPPDGPQPAPRL